MEATGTNDTNGTPARTFWMTSPLWGKCRVIPRDAEPTDRVAMGYVALDGAPGNLKLAIWKDGQWLSRDMKPFAMPVATSYSVEKADGTPIF